MIHVLAGNRRQFDSFCWATDLTRDTDAVYVHSEEQVRGRRRQLLVKVGTWYNTDDATLDRIFEAAKNLDWRIEEWDEEEDPLRLRTRAYRSTQDLASARSATS